MFKLSVITDEVSQDLEVVARFAQRFNLNGLEIRSLWGKKPQELLGDLGKIKKILSDYDLGISAIASPFFKADIESEKEYQEHLEILRNCSELAMDLGTDIIRGFTFWRKGNLDDHLERIIEKFQKPLEIIEDEGVILGIENEPSTFVGNGRELALFLDRLGSKNVKAIWDPGNDTFDPAGEMPYPDGYKYVRGRIVHMHIKDGIRRGAEGKYEGAAIGEGDVDYPGQLKALREDGYRGYLSLETHWRPKVKLTEEEVTKPGGVEFSRLGEEASEVCMRNLLGILSKL